MTKHCHCGKEATIAIEFSGQPICAECLRPGGYVIPQVVLDLFVQRKLFHHGFYRKDGVVSMQPRPFFLTPDFREVSNGEYIPWDEVDWSSLDRTYFGDGALQSDPDPCRIKDQLLQLRTNVCTSCNAFEKVWKAELSHGQESEGQVWYLGVGKTEYEALTLAIWKMYHKENTR